LLALAAKQLDELRRTGTSSPTNDDEAKALAAKLDRIESLVIEAATVIVRVQFEFAQSALAVSPEIERVLVPAARAAERINVRGRTDAVVPGADDPKIALARALAARQYLVDRGVSSDKIKVFSLPAGDRIAPSTSEQGRALNRRVDIELVNRQFAELRRQTVALVDRSTR
jgi:outer membrane protein OmpA-like peptidoglycan-associated protein